MRTAFLLLALGLCLGSGLGKQRTSGGRGQFPLFDSSASDYYNYNNRNGNGNNEQMTAPAFQKGTEYQFQYNAQIASGLIAQDEQSQADEQQKAISRIQCQAKITFGSERHGQLCLRQCRAGQLNEPVKDEQQMQPMSIFEPKKIPSEQERQLQLCAQFDYADGVIERVQFDQNDETWSKNIKRGVLNMIQLNLKGNNAQGLRSENDAEQQQREREEEQQRQQDEQQQGGQSRDTMAKSFNIPEMTVEGACQTTYTINTANPSQRCSSAEGTPCSFNVTKAINFKQCSKIADVAYGYQTQQQQPQCAQCQMDWFKQVQQQRQQGLGSSQYNNQQQANAQHPCAKCDPKEVKEQQVDRSTVLRFVLKCGQQQKSCQNCPEQQKPENCENCCQLDRTELLSQYVYKNTKTENGPYGAAMHTVVSAQLQLRSVEVQKESVPTQPSGQDEQLMYDNGWETDAKRFYMFGDEEYPDAKSSPFHQVPTVQQAQQALRKLVEATQDQEKGIEPQEAIQLQRLVKMLRMSSKRELQQIIQEAQQHQDQQQKAKHIFVDALAICGTRNCVKKLAEQIEKLEVSPAKAAQSLASLTSLPAPSDEIVETVQNLCTKIQQQQQQQNQHGQQALKQSCLLTFGALVNELCQHKTQKAAQQTVYGTQSGFQQQEQCPSDKKQQYKQALFELYEQAQTTYDKVLVLTALGNAGIDSSTRQLAEIIKDKGEQRVVRVKAIDALRRLRTQQPRQIQQILLPIFQNAREQPQVRTAAFAILMYTLPEQSVCDQLAFTISQEPNKQVQAFAYRTMKMLANSKNPVHQQIGKHIKSALKLANVDEQQLRASGKWQIPMYSQQLQEGLFITLASTISQRSSLPAYAHAQIDSVVNDQFHINKVKLYLMQQEAEQWYEQALNQFGQQKTRGQRRDSDDYAGNSQQSLRNIYSALGIKSRRSYNYQQEQQYDSSDNRQQKPFAIACLRTGDVDQACIAADEQNLEKSPMPACIKEVLQSLKNGQKPSLARMLQHVQQQQQIRAAIATNLNEKEAMIPTSSGVPLRMTSAVSMVAAIQGQLQIEQKSGGVSVEIKAQPMANGVHIQKMEAWTPFMVSGVESIRSAEANIPLHAEATTGQQQGLELKMRLPRQQTRLFGAHSLPFTYTAEVDQRSKLVREPRHVRSIQNPKLERQQHETSKVVGAQSLGIPVHIHAHYHWPSQPTSYQEFFQMLMATDNAIHATYRPNQDTPELFQVRLSGAQFQPSSGQMPKLQDFYANQFEKVDSDEDEYDFQQDSHSQRRQKLQTFLGQYQPRRQYKHSLKATVQTIGGKDFKAQCEMQAHCDDKLQMCSILAEAQRSAMSGEQQKWTGKAQAQLVMPETVDSVQQMQQLSEKNNKFACQAECQWGADQKQQIRIRIKGEQVQRSAWRQLQQQGRSQQMQNQQQQQQNRLKRRTAFLNKFDMEAQYNNLKPDTQNVFGRALELVKSAYYWNSDSKLIAGQQQQQQQSGQASGKVLATLVIDPITQKHANISVRTPSQLVQLQQIELPVQARPFPLVGQNAASIQSIGQFIARQELKGRAECTVDGRSVDTFDDQEYNAPLSNNCYSVLAKDCANDEQPQFVVMMKAVERSSGQKKLKVISAQDGTIECQQKPSCASSPNCPIQCKVNGQTVNNDDDSEAVDFNNAQKSDVTVHVPGSISVRFNGRKAWLKVSSMYKNAQCGLCGHYDDSAQDQDEWRMGNNQIASSLAEFHRSYTLKSQQDDEQCNEQELDNFYEQKGRQIRQRNQQQDSDEEDVDNNNDDDQDQDWQQENFEGNFDSSEEQNFGDDDEELGQMFGGNSRYNKNQRNSKNGRYTQPPVPKTVVKEMNHDVCFSKQPVKQCPRGTVPSERTTSNFGSSSSQQDNDDNNDDDNQQGEGQQKNVLFACMSRSSPEARQLLRQYRQGRKVLNVSAHGQSITEQMREPKSCRRP